MRLRDTRLRDEINALRLAVPHLVAFSGVQTLDLQRGYLQVKDASAKVINLHETQTKNKIRQ